MRYFYIFACLLIGCAAPASAGDYKGRGLSWTGFYLGAHVGGAGSTIDWTYRTGLETADHDGSGAFGGAQVGYNMQSGAWVFGIEGDISAAGIDGSTPCPNPIFKCASDITMLGSVRLRAGYALSNLMVYATGGFGFGQVEIYTQVPPGPKASTEKTRTGWTIGGGLEYGMGGGWSLKAEYLYYDLGDHPCIVDNVQTVDADVGVHTGKVGLNFRF
jgi:outer membrane immunogenic protein